MLRRWSRHIGTRWGHRIGTWWGGASPVTQLIAAGVPKSNVTLTRTTTGTYWWAPPPLSLISDGSLSPDVTLARATTANYWSI